MYPHLFSTPGVAAFAEAIDAERARQLAKFGDQRHPDGTGMPAYQHAARRYRENADRATLTGLLAWRDVLLEEVYEALAEADPVRLRAELVQVAAVCAAWVSDIDRAPRPMAQQPEVLIAEECGKCNRPFDPTDTTFDGHARQGTTPYCRRCVDRCHDNDSADHVCVICRTPSQP